jgi:hypothetical protein
VRLKKLCRQAGRYWATIRPALLFVAEEERRLRQRRGHFIAWRGIMSLHWIPIQFEKIAPATFKVNLTDLKKGEYGFLPPASSNSGSKIYTFGIE